LLTITHNLLLLYEQALAVRHAVQNQAEDQRRRERKKEHQQIARKNGQPLSTLVARALSATQRSVKFIRWLRRSAPLPTRGNHRRALPQAALCHLMTDQHERQCSPTSKTPAYRQP